MDTFSYVEVEDVAPLVKGGLTSQSARDMLNDKLIKLSSQLSGWFPGLRQIFITKRKEVEEEKLAGNEDAYSDLVNLVQAMIAEAGRAFITNPEGMSSETIGVFAYSRFDSADPSKGPFSKADLDALRAMLLEAQMEQVGIINIGMPNTAYPADVMPTPYTYSNSITRRSWGR